jgi:glycosyltransferase involved in cell wall biosynthesis
MKKYFNYIAPLDIQSGLGTASRSYYNSLLAGNFPVRCQPLTIGHEIHTRVGFSAEHTDFDIDALTRPDSSLITLVHQNADAFHTIPLHHSKEFYRPSAKKIAIWVWELSRFHEQWLVQANDLDEIWAPTNFVRSAIASLIDKPVRVVPYSLSSHEPIKTNFRGHLGLDRDDFVFGYFFDSSSYVERKNPIALLRAFGEVIKKHHNAVLILKITHKHLFDEYLATQVVPNIDWSKVHFLCMNLPIHEVHGLLNEFDCLVSPHRSEGFGLTIAESILMGKPVIATDYSGSRDFLNVDHGYPVAYSMVKIKETMGPYEKGEEWADVDHDDLVSKMCSVIENYDEARRRAAVGKVFMEANYSPEFVGKIIHGVVDF